MKNIALLSLIASLTLATFGNINLGSNAGIHSSENVNGIAIGENAAYAAQKNEGVIAIGNGATAGAKNLKNVVALGSYELAGVDGLEDAVSINNQQLFISKQLNAFALNPLQEDYIGKSPFWYLDGVLHFNAKRIEGLGISNEPIASYDFYLSTDGNDDNDGKSFRTAKRTFRGVWNEANKVENETNFTCAVSAGTYYHYETNTANFIDKNMDLLVRKRITFIALEGAERTCLAAPENNIEDELFGSLAVSVSDTWGNLGSLTDDDFVISKSDGQGFYRLQTLKGFTVKNFTGTYGKTITKTAPTFLGFEFFDCIIRNNQLLHTGNGRGAVFGCNFYNCIFTENIFYHSGGTSYCNMFRYCNFYNSQILSDNIEYNPGNYTGDIRMFSGTCKLYDCFVDYGNYEKVVEGDLNGSSIDKNVTKIFRYPNFKISENVKRENSVLVTENCFEPTNSLKKIDSVFMKLETYTSLHNTTNGVAIAIESPAVRTDGRKDAGWKDSGLALEKSMKARADIRIENGNLVVYQGGAIVGRIPFEAVAMAASAPQTTAQPTETEEPNEPKRLDETAVLMCYPEFDGESKSKE